MAASGAMAMALGPEDVVYAGNGGLPSDVALACIAQDHEGHTVQHDGFLMDIVEDGALRVGVLAVHAKALWTDNHHTGAAKVEGVDEVAEEDRMQAMREEEVKLSPAVEPRQEVHEESMD
jgi:hypothetical protein